MSVHREINAHLHTAQRHIERGEYVKAEQHLIAATAHSEANGIPHFGRYSLQQILRRAGQHELQEQQAKFKERFK